MAYAQINSQENSGLMPPIPDVNIKMLVNAKGNVCLVHDRPFSQTPLWIKYKQSSRLVEILFDNGSVLSIDWSITDALNSYLVNANKVNVVRTEQSKPVEGWETLLINDQYN